MKYFHAASRLAGVRYTATSSTVASVAASIATHSRPMLFVSSASSIVNENSWYMLWNSRIRGGVIFPWSRSIRMYGPENSAVVNATNAVRATRKTFSESTKNCSCSTSSGPSAMTIAVRHAEATSVARLKATLTSGARSRCPTSPSTPAPTSGIPRTASSASILTLPSAARACGCRGCRTARGSGT